MSERLFHPKYLKRSWHLQDNNIEEVVRDNGTWTGEAYRDNGYGKSMGKFDSADTKFTVDNNSVVQDLFNGGASISMLVIADSVGEGGGANGFRKENDYSMFVQNESAGVMKIGFYHWFSGTDGLWTTTATILNVGEPTLITVDYDNLSVGNDPIFYVNDEMPALTEGQTPTGTADDTTSDFIIGNSAAQTTTWDGGIGDVMIHKGMLMTWDEHIALRREIIG